MPAIEWLRDGRALGRLALREGVVQRLGRGEGADGRVEGDAFVSRVHFEAVLEDGALLVRKISRAANALYHGGVQKEELRLEAGESFVIGTTRFRFVSEAPAAAEIAPAPAADRLMESEEVYAVSDRMRLKDLLELPEILRTKQRNDFYFHIAGMLRLATGARWAAVV
ncbi:MAG TPA: FHA domain-containing protein, partial [Elusimicrobiota bacterium]|nr:FHA domain-containing protein [Elusimicrobiota bacterium]